jgi:HPt (histidine-containing phosphotransfer) domain-containing protein
MTGRSAAARISKTIWPSDESVMGMRKANSELVPVEKYPQLLPPARRKQALSALRSSETLAKAGRAIALRSADLHGAVLEQVAHMEQAARAQDWTAVFAAAHEVRGLAGTAGLPATGRIANGLCHYLDAMAQRARAPDSVVAGLHLDAILRSARTGDDAARHGDAVAQQLSALVAHKLSEIKDSAGV